LFFPDEGLPRVSDETRNVLFLCTGNSARSVFAEVYLNAKSKGRFQARINEDIGHPPLLGIHRIPFDNAGALLSGVIDRGLQQLARDASATVRSGDKEANHRPDRLPIDRRQNTRVFENRIFFSRRQSTPAHWLVTAVSNDAGNFT